jgi:hypothetical protein
MCPEMKGRRKKRKGRKKGRWRSRKGSVCGSDGMIYDSHCELHREACRKGQSRPREIQGGRNERAYLKQPDQISLSARHTVTRTEYFGDQMQQPTRQREEGGFIDNNGLTDSNGLDWRKLVFSQTGIAWKLEWRKSDLA